ncbi:uncharacterized protein [Amphiura filiformis]|uniref:uncharacterized protein n=1 Tax=Amphiura filiformis TaxID=82378 RepID=UPI003B21E0C8
MSTVIALFFIVASFLAFAKLNQSLNSKSCFIPVPAKYAGSTRYKWSNIVGSFIHATLVSLLGAYCLYSTPMYLTERIIGYTTMALIIISISQGYFIYDIWDLLRHQGLHTSWPVILHHIALLLGGVANIGFHRLIGWALISMLIEYNTIFLHARMLLLMYGFAKSSAIFRVTNALNICTFVTFRLGYIIIHIPKIWQDCGQTELIWCNFLIISTAILFVTSLLLFYRLLRSDVFVSKTKRNDTNGAANDILSSYFIYDIVFAHDLRGFTHRVLLSKNMYIGLCSLVVGFLCFTKLNEVLNSNVCFNTVPHKYVGPTKHKWVNVVGSVLHATVVALAGSYCLYSTPEFRTERITTYTKVSESVLGASAGYFVYDAIDLQKHQGFRASWPLILHHVSLLAVGLVINIYLQYLIGYSIIASLVEYNSIFLHGRQLLLMYGCSKTSPIFRLNIAFNVGTFLILRLGVLLKLILLVVEDRDVMASIWWNWLFLTLVILFLMNIVLFYRLIKSDFLSKKHKIDKDTDDAILMFNGNFNGKSH